MQSICLILVGILENLEVLLVLGPLLRIEVKDSRCVLELTASLDNIFSLFFVDNYSVNAVSIFVVHVDTPQRTWHDHIGEPCILLLL